MDELLDKLRTQVLILNLKEGLEHAPTLDGFEIKKRDDRTLEVEVERELGVNGLFAGLSELNIEVLSLRNKQNRLEQMFMDMLDTSRNGNAP